ncbi:MAG TPA: serine hydrolase domain-containing protein [Sphingobacterium sp.]|nr:serine hydrolase domain-containing protein [Sphingobacterium sp.]
MRIFVQTLAVSFLIVVLQACGSADEKKTIRKPKQISQAELDSVALLYADSQRNERIHDFMVKLHKNAGFNGNVLVAQDDEIIYLNSFGWANYLLKDSLDINSKFELASVSKPLTAMGVLKLVEKGELTLTQTVNDFFPEFPYPDITIKQLLSHRSGLPNYLYFTENIWKERNIGMKNQEVIDMLIEHKPNRYGSPDGRFQYNNTNYLTLAAIIEKVTGKDFAVYMKEEIFDPAGMHNTAVLSKAVYEKIPTDVIGHDRAWRYSVVQNFLDGPVGDKGIYSTVKDLYLFDRALNEGRIVDSALLDSSYHTSSEVSHNGLFGYGYGWRTFNPENNPIVYHTGWWHGFKSLFVRDITQNKTIILLTNMANASLSHLDELYKILDMPVLRRNAYDGTGRYLNN